MFLTVYHYLNVCYYGGPMLNKKIKKTWSEYIIPYKTEVATDVTDFDNEQKFHSASYLKLRSNVYF